MNRSPALLLACLALPLAAVGCGSDDEGEEGAATPEDTVAEQPAEKTTGAGGPARTVAVSMKNTLYVPMDSKVKVGDTIKWTNVDPFPHTVTKSGGPGPEFDSGTVDGDETYEQKFTRKGKVDYVCTIHPRQVGTVTVE